MVLESRPRVRTSVLRVNTAEEVFRLAGEGSFWDPYNIWAIYIDALPRPGSGTVGGGGAVAVLPRGDVDGLLGQNPGDDRLCRWVGGLGHEIGHALGLPHPAPCDDQPTTPGCDVDLMYLGYGSYPACTLNAQQGEFLRDLAFFQPVALVAPPFNCTDLALDRAVAGVTPRAPQGST